jgi:hypothetical protein
MLLQLIGAGRPELHPRKAGYMGEHAEGYIAKKYFDGIQNPFKIPAPGNYPYFPAAASFPDPLRGPFGRPLIVHYEGYDSLILSHT